MALVVTALVGTNVAWPLTSWQLFSRLRGPTQSTCRPLREPVGELRFQRVVSRISLNTSPPTTVVVRRELRRSC